MPVISRFPDSRLFLAIALGGLLALFSFSVYRVQVDIGKAIERGEELRRAFEERNRALNELRNDIVLTGTYARDFLLDPDVEAAKRHRGELLRIEARIERLLESAALRGHGQSQARIAEGYREFRKSLESVLDWPAERRRKEGFAFLRAEMFPQRTALLALADQAGSWNETEFGTSTREIQGMFTELKAGFARQATVLLLLGASLSVFAFWKIRGLERQASLRFAEVEAGKAQLVTAQEVERKRISRELHDGVAQNLGAAKMAIEGALKHERTPQLEEALELTGAGLQAVRNMSLLLRPSMLDDLGLGPALDWLAREAMRRTQMKVRVETEGLDGLPEAVSVCVFRVVQEALRNAEEHAKANEVAVRVVRSGATLKVSAEDNGVGYDAERKKGLGTLGMRERVQSLGGKMEIASQEGVGTVVVAEIPV
jgi:signal transduction histidine kinase